MSRYLPASETGIYSENLLTIVTNGRTRLEKVWSGRTSLKKVWSEVLFLMGTQKFPMLVIRRKTSFSLSKPSSKFTILLILLRHLANISRQITLSILLIIAECRTCVKNGLSKGLAHCRVAVIQVV